ncbi:MAG: glycine dehydrogenase, partial [Alphaproteobacteria bacterium]
VKLVTENFFNEFTVSLPTPAAEIVARLAEKRILAGVPLSRLYPGEKALANHLLIAVTELAEEKDMDALCAGLKEVLP